MKLKNRAAEIVKEWFPDLEHSSKGYEAARHDLAQQLTAEFKHVVQQAYSAGYNACLQENQAVKPQPRRSSIVA